MGVVTSLKARSKMRQEDFVPLYNPGRETTQVLSRLNFDALRTHVKKQPSLLPSPHLRAQRPGGGAVNQQQSPTAQNDLPRANSHPGSPSVSSAAPKAFCNGIWHEQ